MNLLEIHNTHDFIIERLMVNRQRLRMLNNSYFGSEGKDAPPPTPPNGVKATIPAHMDRFRAAHGEIGKLIAELEGEIDRLTNIFLDNDGPQSAQPR